MCTPTSSVDVVVRCGPRQDQQLLYTLRSLSKHMPHRRLLTAGCRPHWTDCEHIDVPPSGGKFAHAYAVLRAILDADDLTETVVIADDDMYLMRPLEVLPAYHRGPLGDVTPTWTRRQAHADTLAVAGPDALCRDLHVPTLVHRAELAARLDAIALPHHRKARLWWRTLAGPACTEAGDAKVREPGDPMPDGDWLSSSDRSWPGLAPMLRERFPDRCGVEAA